MSRALRIGYPSPGTYSLIAQQGSYALSGQAASLTANGASAPGEVLFAADFSNLNANGSNLYNFSNRFTPGTNWTHTHVSNGNYDGGPCARITLEAGQEQYQLGWETPSLGGGPYSVGDEIFIRFRVRYANDYRWGSADTRNKLVLFGSDTLPGSPPQSRIIVYSMRRQAYDNNGGLLGWQNFYDPPGGGVVFTHCRPGFFGLSGANDWSDLDAIFGCLSASLNIGATCCGPVLVTYGNRATPPAPGPNSDAPTDGWYHAQLRIRSGLGTSGRFTWWVNNNDFDNPTQDTMIWHEEDEDQGSDIGVAGWTGSAHIGGFCDVDPSSDRTFDLGAFEVATGFDDEWYPE